MDKAYRIITIPEESVPLVSGNASRYSLMSVIIVVVALLIAFLLAYVIVCQNKRSRILSLGGKDHYLGWNMRKLDETVLNLEYERTEDMSVEVKVYNTED